jgi:hypothetical protein
VKLAHLAAVVVAVAVTATACGSSAPTSSTSSSPPSDGRVPSQGGSSASGSTQAQDPASGALSTTTVATATVSGDVGPPALGDGFTAFPWGSPRWTKVAVVADGGTKVTEIVHTRWPHGMINWVAATGDWIGFVDQSAEQGDAAPRVLWRVGAVDRKTGRTVELASNGDKPDPYVPEIRGGGGYLFWSSAEPDRSAKESVWRPGDDRPTVVLRHAEMTPGSESYADGKLVYLGPNGAGATGRTVGGDCWSISVSGGEPVALTHTALAMSCAATPGRITWSEHIDPKTSQMPSDGVLNDPYQVWTQTLGGGTSQLLHQGYIMGDPVVGDTFVEWAGEDADVLHGFAGSHAPDVRLDPHNRYPTMIAARGSRVAYRTAHGSRATVHVLDITSH